VTCQVDPDLIQKKIQKREIQRESTTSQGDASP